MKVFGLSARLRDREDEMGGGAGAGRPGADLFSPEQMQAINGAINSAMAAFGKRDLPKLLNTNIQQALSGFGDTFMEQFFERIQNELPSDEEIAQMEAEGGGYGDEEYEEEDGQQGYDPRLQQHMVDPQMNAQLRKLQMQLEAQRSQIEQMEELRAEAENRAEMADRQARIGQVLGKFPFASDQARKVFENYVSGNVQRDEQGNLIAGDLPLDQWVEDQIPALSGLLAPKAIGGAGAMQGGRLQQNVPSMEQIKPGMSQQDRAAILQHATTELLKGQGS